MPTTSTSSWIAALATVSGVCLRPVKITSIPASRSACATTVTPIVCVSRPSFASSTRIGGAAACGRPSSDARQLACPGVCMPKTSRSASQISPCVA